MIEYKEIVREWASEIRDIRRVWIFGSRARGDHCPDSDLDVLVEAWSGAWEFENEKWTDDLQKKLKPLKLHLVEYQGEESELAKRADHERVLIYSSDGT